MLREPSLERWDNYNPFETYRNPGPYGDRGLNEKICSDGIRPCSGLVKLYAMFGLHRYNLLHGKNYKLIRVEKYAYRGLIPITPYYITFSAKHFDDGSEQTFITKVDQNIIGKLILTCYIATPKGCEPYELNLRQPRLKIGDVKFPEWPPQNPFENNDLFYVLTKSELQENEWIRLYLELAVVASNPYNRRNPDLSGLEIVKVATNTSHLCSENATFYISYKDHCEVRVGTNVDRIAVVERSFNRETQCFTLVGQNQSSQGM
ncbi:unnamed protein product [Cochlearia groenlandica]